jgi:outer membrane protein assembly factor BamC
MGAVMQVRNIVIVVIAASLFAGCSSFTNREVDYKAGAIKTQSLEVPPGLTAPETEQRYTIPGKEGEKVASYSEYSKQKAEQPCVAPASAPVVAQPLAAPNAKLQENNGTKSIVLGEPFDRSWRRVGLALDYAHLVTSDKDRSKGIYFLVAAPDKDKKKQPDYQLIVRENGTNSEVTVVDQNGKSDAETTRLVEVVFQSLDKSERGNDARPPRGDAVRRSR